MVVFELMRQGLPDVGLADQAELLRGLAEAQVLPCCMEHALQVLRLELAGILQQLADVGFDADAGDRLGNAILLAGARE